MTKQRLAVEIKELARGCKVLVPDSNIQSQIIAFQPYILSFARNTSRLAEHLPQMWPLILVPKDVTSKGSMAIANHHLPVLFFGLMGLWLFAFYKH